MIPKLGLTRTVVRPNYAVIARDGYVPSVLPGWTDCAAYVQISGAMGGCVAGLIQILFDCKPGGTGTFESDHHERVFYVTKGSGKLNGHELRPGSYAYVPPSSALRFFAGMEGAELLMFEKAYEAMRGVAPPLFVVGHEENAAESPFLGDPRARLKTLFPTSIDWDLAVNIFTYDPGATLPFVETHVMEHGMLFLSGSGVYRLNEDWHPVTAGDAVWIAPYCPQWFIAAGPEPARYIYYKDVNRAPL
jgi:(S)-ureidoglycine aminohydrolase